MSKLPHPRTLITALIDTLSHETSSSSSPSDRAEQQQRHEKDTTGSNVNIIKKNNNNNNNNNNPPILNASPNAKALLLTLHALYPTDVLPALDLLDRRLVIKLILKKDDDDDDSKTRDIDEEERGDDRIEEEEEKGKKSKEASKDSSGDENPEHDGKLRRSKDGSGNDITVYYVRSAAAAMGETAQRQRRMVSRSGAGDGAGNDASTTTSIAYEVRTGAWNCTCPAFMFAAFPVRKPFATDPSDPSDTFDPVGITRRALGQSGGGSAEDEEDEEEKDDDVQKEEGKEDVMIQKGIEEEEEESPAPATATAEMKYHADWSFGGGSRTKDATRSHSHSDAHANANVDANAETPVCKHLLACVLAQRCTVFAGMVEERTVSRAEMAACAAGGKL